MSTADDTRSVAIPKGWTNEIPAQSQVETMLAVSTNIQNIQVDLAEIKGTMYLFHSGTDYYFWNSATEEGSLVTNPKSYDALLELMEDNMQKVQVTPLPEPEEEEE